MCGGEPADFDRVKSVLDVYAKMCALIGGPGAGQLTKMVNKIAIAGRVQGTRGSAQPSASAPLDIEKVISVISKGRRNPGRWKTAEADERAQVRRFRLFGSTGCARTSASAFDEAKRNGSRLPASALIDQFSRGCRRAAGALGHL